MEDNKLEALTISIISFLIGIAGTIAFLMIFNKSYDDGINDTNKYWLKYHAPYEYRYELKIDSLYERVK